MKAMKILALLTIMSVVLISCNKDDVKDTVNYNTTSAVKVKLIDDDSRPEALKSSTLDVMFDAVNVDISSVSVFYGDTVDGGTWVDLETNAGIYDLMTINNLGVVISDTNFLLPGYYGQMRLQLGDDNFVVIDSVSYELKTPSAQQTGLKINLDYEFKPGFIYEITLDFDPFESIVIQGNGNFLLKPVLRVVSIIEVGPVTQDNSHLDTDRSAL